MLTEFYVLPVGEVCVGWDVLAPGVRSGGRVHIPVWSFLIKTDNGHTIVVDTGLHPGNIDDPHYTNRHESKAMYQDIFHHGMRSEDYLLRRLADLHVAPEEVTDVINTHLHYDHCGNNRLFKNAKIWVQREQYEEAKEDPGGAYEQELWDDPSLTYELVDGEPELFPGVTIVRSPGHAPGHQSVLIDLKNDGKFILCGDAIILREMLEHDSWGAGANLEELRQTGLRLEKRAFSENAELIFGHDPGQARTLRQAPFYYS